MNISLLKETEVDSAVAFFFEEAGVGLEVVVGGVFQDEKTVGVEQALRLSVLAGPSGGENLVGQGVDPFQGVGRVGENYVEALAAQGEEVEDIVVDDSDDVVQPERVGLLLDETGVVGVHFDAMNAGRAPGGELETDGTRASEEVEHLQVLKLVDAVEGVEKPFFCEIGRRARLVALRGSNAPAPQCAADDPHKR